MSLLFAARCLLPISPATPVHLTLPGARMRFTGPVEVSTLSKFKATVTADNAGVRVGIIHGFLGFNTVQFVL